MLGDGDWTLGPRNETERIYVLNVPSIHAALVKAAKHPITACNIGGVPLLLLRDQFLPLFALWCCFRMHCAPSRQAALNETAHCFNGTL